MGLSMSTTSKQRLVAECGEHVNSKLTSYLKINPLLKITGDNLDVYIKTGNQSKDVQNTDLHLFASNAISCRASKPDMDTKRPVVTGLLTTDILALKESEMEKIMSSYTILIARILSSMDQFKWMLSVIPQHILHPHSAAMSEKSKVFQLPIQHKNEAKYEDVLDIMDEYEHVLQDAFREAHGNIEMLDKYRVVTGGDQLTKVRFVGAVNLRLMSPNPTKRLEHVQPIICELWHLKQDYLEKCFKAMFKRESLTVEGTLAFYRNVLKKMDVTGKVKGHFQAHSDFFKLMTSMLIQDQAVELFGIDGSDESFPPGIGTSSRSKKLAAIKIIGKSILDELGFNQLEENLSDELNNYSCQLCLRGLHYLQLEDTASEGNLSNVVPNIKMLIPIFYGSSCLSKYMVECIDYVMKVEHYLSPLDKLRVLEGSFVNMKGGLGNNVEADLVQEHSVRNQKTLIRGLGANKTKSSIEAVTAASPVITSICKNFDNNYKIKPKGNRHTRKVSSEDIKCLRTSLRKIQPFKRIEKRSCPHFNGITRQPCGNVNTIKREQDITRIMERLGRGWVYEEGEGEDDGEQDDENNDDNEEDLPEIP